MLPPAQRVPAWGAQDQAVDSPQGMPSGQSPVRLWNTAIGRSSRLSTTVWLIAHLIPLPCVSRSNSPVADVNWRLTPFGSIPIRRLRSGCTSGLKRLSVLTR